MQGSWRSSGSVVVACGGTTEPTPLPDVGGGGGIGGSAAVGGRAVNDRHPTPGMRTSNHAVMFADVYVAISRSDLAGSGAVDVSDRNPTMIRLCMSAHLAKAAAIATRCSTPDVSVSPPTTAVSWRRVCPLGGLDIEKSGSSVPPSGLSSATNSSMPRARVSYSGPKLVRPSTRGDHSAVPQNAGLDSLARGRTIADDASTRRSGRNATIEYAVSDNCDGRRRPPVVELYSNSAELASVDGVGAASFLLSAMIRMASRNVGRRSSLYERS